MIEKSFILAYFFAMKRAKICHEKCKATDVFIIIKQKCHIKQYLFCLNYICHRVCGFVQEFFLLNLQEINIDG